MPQQTMAEYFDPNMGKALFASSFSFVDQQNKLAGVSSPAINSPMKVSFLLVFAKVDSLWRLAENPQYHSYCTLSSSLLVCYLA